MELKETKQNFTLVVKEEVIFYTEIFEEIQLEHVGEPKPLWQLSKFVRHDFGDPFMHKDNVQNESFQFFNFISPTIGIWMRRKHDPSLSYNYKEIYGLTNYM